MFKQLVLSSISLFLVVAVMLPLVVGVLQFDEEISLVKELGEEDQKEDKTELKDLFFTTVSNTDVSISFLKLDVNYIYLFSSSLYIKEIVSPPPERLS